MAQRKRVGLKYFGGYDYMSAIPIYMQNVVKALRLLDDARKPHLVIFHQGKAPLDDMKEIGYPYAEYVDLWPAYNLAQRAVNKVARAVGAGDVWKHPNLPADMDVIYPCRPDDLVRNAKKRIVWVVDMQQFILPEFFTEEERQYVADLYRKVSEGDDMVVFSSRSSMNDYFRFYPEAKHPTFVLRFAVFADLSGLPSKEELCAKYDLKPDFFLTPNQFWPHKNHQLLLKAVDRLRERHPGFDQVLTGVSTSYRNQAISDQLHAFIDDRQLGDTVKILGFIPRKDLLGLMKYSMALIQPSLFEGWSTLVEESKALNKFLIVSDIDLHKEQVQENCRFFRKDDVEDLTEAMETVLQGRHTVQPVDYAVRQQQYSEDLATLFDL